MDLINEKIISEIKNLNQNFKSKFSNIENIDKNIIREKLTEKGEFLRLNKLSNESLSSFKPMVCIDGSVNRYGGSFPHYIDIFQGLGIISGQKFIKEYDAFINSPLISNLDSDEDLKKKLLAKIEIQTAIKIIENYDIKFILMDGNLIRYHIEVPEDFQLLKNICLEKNILLSGFIKESKTNYLYNMLFGEEANLQVYDKDLLYGVFSTGEGYILEDTLNAKINQGVYSMFLRISNYPGIAGIELLYEQKDNIFSVANLCYSLTSEMSRGVPLIIDIVDKEVKIDDRLARELINSYIDKDIVERFFRSERSMRKY